MSAVGSVAETHPACYSAGTGDYFPETKVAELEGNHSPLSKAEVKNEWNSISTSRSAFMHSQRYG